MHAPAAPTPPAAPRALALRGAALALACLLGAVVVAFPASLLVTNAVVHAGFGVGPVIFAAVLATCGGLGGAAWGASLAATLGRRHRARPMALGGALGFGLAAAVGSTALTVVETRLLQRVQAGEAVSMEVAFWWLFPGASALVVLAATLAVALGAGLGRRSAGVALHAAAVGALTFLAASLLLAAAGWHVGGPGAEARFTMVVVTIAGLVTSTAAAGAVAARRLGGAFAPPPHGRCAPTGTGVTG